MWQYTLYTWNLEVFQTKENISDRRLHLQEKTEHENETIF